MNAVVVGADKLGNIPDYLATLGITIMCHITGRKVAQQKNAALPYSTDLLILFTDFVGHNVMRQFRAVAKDERIKFIACRRSVCCLEESLKQCLKNETCISLRKCEDCPVKRYSPR